MLLIDRPKVSTKRRTYFFPMIGYNPSNKISIYSTLICVEDQSLWFKVIGIVEVKGMNIGRRLSRYHSVMN